MIQSKNANSKNYNETIDFRQFESGTYILKAVSEDEQSVTFQLAGDSKLVLKAIAGSGFSGSEAKSVANCFNSWDFLPSSTAMTNSIGSDSELKWLFNWFLMLLSNMGLVSTAVIEMVLS